MKFNFGLFSEAELEILHAALWYENKREGLGEDLILSYEAALNYIVTNPFLYQIRYRNLRFANVYKFPFQIIYFVEGSMITIVAFRHCKQNTKTLKKRIYKKD